MDSQKGNGRRSIRDSIDAIKDKNELFRWTHQVKGEALDANKKTRRRWREALERKAKELDKPKSTKK